MLNEVKHLAYSRSFTAREYARVQDDSTLDSKSQCINRLIFSGVPCSPGFNRVVLFDHAEAEDLGFLSRVEVVI